jgi:hypothetical protein
MNWSANVTIPTETEISYSDIEFYPYYISTELKYKTLQFSVIALHEAMLETFTACDLGVIDTLMIALRGIGSRTTNQTINPPLLARFFYGWIGNTITPEIALHAR